MNEEKKDKVFFAFAIVGAILCAMMFICYMNLSYTTQTTELTIEHLWEEGGEYYFADTNGTAFKLGNIQDVNEKILYGNMPKQRFGKLREGGRYNCSYVSGMNTWISISERETEK